MVKYNHGIASETSGAVDEVIKRYVGGLEESVSYLPLRRLRHLRLRDLSVRLGYEIAGGGSWQEVVPVCAAYELENCSSYVINWIFDEKGGAKTRKDVNNLIISGMQLRELAEKVLRDYGLEEIIPSINEIQEAGYRGQYADINLLKVERLEEFTDVKNFMREYEQRCRNLSGVFHGHCLLSGSKLSGNETPILYEIGSMFGEGLQASNDIGDFALPENDLSVLEKPYNDQFSDLKQGKLTLPVYFLLTKTSGEIRKMIRRSIGKDLTPIEREIMIDHFRTTGVFEKCLAHLKEKRKRAKTRLYEGFERSPPRDRISEMLSAITHNKFLNHLKSP